MGSHARFLQLQGQDKTDVDGVATLDLAKTKLTEKERALLEYVKVLTLEPANVRDTHVAGLRAAGWKDEEIFEASFTTSLFAFFNRMADAYGLDYPQGGWLPPAAAASLPAAP
uniref:Peroxidase n=1 Tax=uncultured Armatimonadetes bacterium TaxID=157466 RepID=A0A6J4HV69_9BACT|nr:hypothetical protein AVDCRST_MAG63-1085 [uncultured Armatimonadetes bacterium]